MSLAALIGIDKERYDQGNKFLSQDPYLQNFQGRAPITFNESPVINQGIMGPGRYPYPIIPQGDGGGGITFGLDKGEITSDVGFGNLDDQTGMGYTLTEEDKEEIAAQKNKNRLSQAAQLGLFALNPMGYIMGKGINKAVGFVKDRFFGGDGDGDEGFDQDAYDAGKASAAAQAQANRDFARSGGDSGSTTSTASAASTAGADTSRSDDSWSSSPFQYGGRVGFSNGGLSTYEIFKLGELGFDTKGGTVTAPFGGIKVLRDILKVNQYAYGGRAGFARGGRTDAESQYGADSYGSYSYDDDNNRDDDNNNPPSNDVQTSNLNFNLVRDIDPSFNYASRFGTLGGVLNTTRTIEEEEPVGTVGYYSPTGNFGIGYDTDKGPIGTANLGNLNLGYTGTGGPTLNYSGSFANDAGRFGVNYNTDSGLNLGVSYNKTFNNGGIVGLYR